MVLKIRGKKEIKEENRWWFAWRPILAEDEGANLYLIWLKKVFRANTMGIISYHI